MKFRLVAICLLLAGGLSTSCIQEDHSDCRNIYRLALSYMGDEETEIFSEKIDRVQMYVFDEQNNCVVTEQLSDSDVKAQMTTLPALVPGKYNIVCIGNAYQTGVESLSSGNFDQIVFAANDYIDGKTVSGNDPLYWSSTDYEIKPFDARQTVETRTTYFESSHFDIYVEVAGVPAQTKASGYPSVQLVGVLPQTDFNNTAKGSPVKYYMETRHDGDLTLTAENCIMRHEDHEEVWLKVVNADGTAIAEINFAEHIAEHGIDVSKNECQIPFRIEMKSASVNITVPNWFIENVKPEF